MCNLIYGSHLAGEGTEVYTEVKWHDQTQLLKVEVIYVYPGLLTTKDAFFLYLWLLWVSIKDKLSFSHWGSIYIHQSLSSSIGNFHQLVKIESLPLCILLVKALHICSSISNLKYVKFFVCLKCIQIYFPWQLPFTEFFKC